jgi:micrococcal nuclease
MRRLALGLLAVALPAALGLWLAVHADREAPDAVALAPKPGESYRCTRVVDGDTLVIEVEGQSVRIRLKGVDTPESVHPSKPVEAFAKEASAFTEQLVEGRHVLLHYERERPETDRYGRVLGYVYRVSDGLDLNAEIIRRGYGHAYTRYPFRRMEEFRALERTARRRRAGLWADPAAAEQELDKKVVEEEKARASRKTKR